MTYSAALPGNLLDAIPCAVICTDLRGNVTYWNQCATELLQWSDTEIVGHNIKDTLFPHLYRQKQRIVKSFLKEYAPWAGECVFYRKNGTPVSITIESAPLQDKTGKPYGYAAVLFSCQKLQDTHYQAILAHSEDIFIRFNRMMEFLYVSPAIQKITGLPAASFIGKKCSRMLPADNDFALLRQHVQHVFRTSQSITFETHFGSQCFEVELIPETLDDKLHTVLVICRDISSQKSLENEMAKLDKLHLVGEMAAGIGHEVRNPLTTVRGFLQMFLLKDKYAAKDREYFSTMIDELDRANDIITEFLSLAKNKQRYVSLNNLNHIIETISPLIQADGFHAGHQLLVELHEVPYFPMEESEIRQLILNLVRNAYEAMAHPGTVKIGTRLEENMIVLTVQDEGSGIPADILEKIGTPFFTTKDGGNGLGVAICYNIAANHDARIFIDSSQQGTTFTIRFPQKATEESRPPSSDLSHAKSYIPPPGSDFVTS